MHGLNSEESTKSILLPEKALRVFFPGSNGQVIYKVLKDIGAEFVDRDEKWMLAWTNYSLGRKTLAMMRPYQKINHFPGMNEICRKDLLAKNLNRISDLLPDIFDFYPKTWCLPSQVKSVQEFVEKNKKTVLIVKPTSGCQGKGIYLSFEIFNRMKSENAVCQPYISMPLLIDGFKFDLRVYVLLTSVDPLRMYVYNDGIARFATEPYAVPSKDNMHNRCMHLTNYAVNKKSNSFSEDKVSGSKRSMSRIEEYISSKGFSVKVLRNRIDKVVVKTMLSVLAQVQHEFHITFPSNPAVCPCFQILGFDILLTSCLRPKLIEVNLSPSLVTYTPVDLEVKESLVCDVINLVNVSQELGERLKWEDRRKMNTRIRRSSSSLSSRVMTDNEISLLEEQLKHEEQCLGNFRRVFPSKEHNYDIIIEKSKIQHRLSIPKRSVSEISHKNSQRKGKEVEKRRPTRRTSECPTPEYFWGVAYIT